MRGEEQFSVIRPAEEPGELMPVQDTTGAAVWAEVQSFASRSFVREVLVGPLNLFFVLRCQPLELAMQSLGQFFEAGHSQKIELDQLHHPSSRTLAHVKLQEHRRNQGQVNLDRHSLGAFGQPMTTAQNALDPPEKQLHLPAPAIKQADQLC